MDSEILISPDMNGLIIGIDWLEKQGQFIWDFAKTELSLRTTNGWNFRRKTKPEEYEEYM